VCVYVCINDDIITRISKKLEIKKNCLERYIILMFSFVIFIVISA
jgi:hypothetical protein